MCSRNIEVHIHVTKSENDEIQHTGLVIHVKI